jgi:ribonucleoside-diphosphate reductase alpha chain
MGLTANKEIPMVQSLMDYLGRWLALKFLSKEAAMRFHNADLVEKAYREGSKSKDAFAMSLPIVDEGAQASGFARVAQTAVPEEGGLPSAGNALSHLVSAKQQGFTGSICTGCGGVRVKRNGSCEVCLDCGATSGCS